MHFVLSISIICAQNEWSASCRFPGPSMQGPEKVLNDAIFSCFRSAKANAKTTISAHAVQMQTTPFRHLLTPESSPISSPCWTPGIAQTGICLRSDSTESLSEYNRAMDEIASKVAVERKPLTSQLDSWEKSTAEQKAVLHSESN